MIRKTYIVFLTVMMAKFSEQTQQADILECIEGATWDLRSMFMNTNCSKPDTDPAKMTACIEKKICFKPKCSSFLKDVNETNCDDDPKACSKVLLLKLICLKQVADKPCIRVLSDAYMNVSNSNQQIMQNLNTTTGRCCIAPLIKVYNSSGNVTELLPSSWVTGLPDSVECIKQANPFTTMAPSRKEETTSFPQSEVKQTTSVIKPTSTTSHSNKIETTPMKRDNAESSEKNSARLKASLVIASIIFIVVAFIIGRFIYHRIQKKKRAKYEDYGYSQLKVILDDNLYEDEEDDDDQLLSAT